jgi:hypothetical protein
MSDPVKANTTTSKAPNVERIPVRTIQFGHLYPTQIKGAAGQNSITASDQKNKSRYEIEFIPAWRHHRIVFHPIDGAPVVYMVHEAKVETWEPM